MRAIAIENGQSLDHHTSCPCVSATILLTPAVRSPGASSAKGAAAPKKTVAMFRSRTSLLTLLPTRNDGSKTLDASRITSTP